MEEDLPYRAEYAKSSRASCRGCKSTIEKGTLRLAVVVQSPMFDGKVPHWYHNTCFFNKQKPKTVDDIAHFESLRYEDQENIRSKIQSGATTVVPTKKGKKRDAATALNNKAALELFVLEYSKSSRATCRGCEQKIMKEEIRISKKDFETDIGKRYGGQDMWHHLNCFAKLRSELGYFESADKLKGFKTLKKEDQKMALNQLPAIKQEEVPKKVSKVEDELDSSNVKLEKQLKKQNETMFKYRDRLESLKVAELQQLLEENIQAIPSGRENILDRLADIMTFGSLKPCFECKHGQFVANIFGYKCEGNLTQWSKCNFTTQNPDRKPFTIPEDLKEKYSFLRNYKYVPRTRVFKTVKPTSSSTIVKKEVKEEEQAGPKVIREKPPLYDMEFVILKCITPKDVLKKNIVQLGGKVVTKIKETVMAVISTQEDVDKLSSRIKEAQECDIQIVPEDFIAEAKNYSGRIPELIKQTKICEWGADPQTRLPAEPSTSNLKSKSNSRFTSSIPSKITLKLKNGGAVDPDSGLQDCAHIYESGGNKYSSVLGLTDIQKGKNSYYKLQLLASDSGNQFWLFRSWGRIGTTIGDTKVDKLGLDEAKNKFRQIYEEKTGNSWSNRYNFVKVQGCMYPIDLDYGQDDDIKLDIGSESTSKLAKPIQKLVELIFDVNLMKKVMLEFELDTEKMPLGKLSKSQLQSAYGVLTELQNLIQNNASPHQLIDASNRFYTYVPHSFGIDNPPIIDDLEIVKKKIEMIDNLMEMEIAYNLMKSTGEDHSIDGHYSKLNTDLDVLETESEEYQLISEYVKNTHAATHSHYKLNIEHVFKVKRQGEEKRYKPFRKLKNRKLLWHGSRNTNIAGILSQGLRIAPPEAPVTGYMFGKGIYFADMVSKSANYCCTNPNDNTGILLLCEVALGEMHELEHAKYIEKLPKGKHSVKGLGKSEPDPTATKELSDGVHIPIGKGVTMNRPKATSLLYNEYIVYDVAQVNIKYLLRLNFQYNY